SMRPSVPRCLPSATLGAMTWWQWTVVATGGSWLAFVAALALAGRRRDALAVARLLPDCAVLISRLLRDPRVPRRKKVALWALVAYLALPFDLVPDFIPVAGQLDDAILVALVLRWLTRGGGAAVVREHWPGPPLPRPL